LVLMAIEGYDMQVLAFAAPLIVRDWALPKAALGPTFAAGLLGYLLGATTMTPLADRHGRRIFIIGGTCVFALFTLLSTLAGSLSQLTILRLLAGVGLGASIPALIALNAEFTPARRRATRTTLLFVGYTSGALGGSFIASALMQTYGWQSAFVLGGAAPAALAAVLFFRLPESIQWLALPHEADVQLRRRARMGRILGRSTRRELTVSEESAALPVKQLFSCGRARLTVLLWLACITSLLGHHFLASGLPTVLEGSGMPLSKAIVAGGLIMGGGAVGGLIIGPLLDRGGVLCLAVMFFLSVPCVAAIGLPTLAANPLLALVFCSGVCLVGGQVGLNALVSQSYETSVRSTGTGWALGVGRIGSITGPVIGGILVSHETDPTSLFGYASLPGLASAVIIVMIWVDAKRKARVANES
jgi:AAHS family 4-hydroxybenzoate transporter-like MFS transporter